MKTFDSLFLGAPVKPCGCGSGLPHRSLVDARGVFWTFVCDRCEEEERRHMKEIALYAWVGEDELGSGKVGLKQELTPAGIIPLAVMDYHLDRLAKLKPAMEVQAARYGKKIRLMKFVATGEVAAETKAGS